MKNEVKIEIEEFVDGIVKTNNFLNEKMDVEKYVKQAIELFHEVKGDEVEIAAYVREQFRKF